MIKGFFVLLVLIAGSRSFGDIVPPKTLNAVSDSSKVSFLAVGKPSFIKIKGEGKNVTGSVTVVNSLVNGSFKFPLKTLSTGIDMRDRHMKEKYLKVETYPMAELKLSEINLPKSWSLKNAELKDVAFKGTMTLHDKQSVVSGTFEMLKGANGMYNIKAVFPLKMTEYNIEIPVYAGIHVVDSIDVTVESALQ